MANDDLIRRIAGLTPEQRAILEERLLQRAAARRDAGQGRPAHEGAQGEIPRRTGTGPCPLSFAQQRLWFLDQLMPGSPMYNCPSALRMRGALRADLLEEALDAVVARHEALRTTFQAMGDSPVQVVASQARMHVNLIDLSGVPGAAREAEARQRLDEEARRPFDLARDLMLRATLVKMAEDDHILLLVTHHIASDLWSTGILRRELAAFYRAFAAGGHPSLPELPIQYADYACWQREWMAGEMLEQQLAFWTQHLGDAPRVLELPADRPRTANLDFRGGRYHAAMPAELSRALHALAIKERATPFMAFLAAFDVLLHRYTGQDHLVVGTPIAGRRRVETEGLIGFFVNTLPLHADLSGDTTFRGLLGRIRGSALDAYEHQDIPFEKLVESIHPERDLSHTPLVQVVFAFQNAPRSELELPGLALTPVGVETQTAKFDLQLTLHEVPQGLSAVIEYRTELFDPETIARMAGHLRVLLDGIAAEPDRPVAELPLLTEAERHQLLVEWNPPAKDAPPESCVHELFEAQAERRPDAVAAVFEDQALTYGELNARANRLAHHLRRLGVGPESLVGLCVERSLEMVVGLLGILKAGGAYVPLDPDYPRERLALMLEDTRAPVIVTQGHLLDRLPEHAARVVCLDADRAAMAQESDGNPAGGATAENLAYVIYTSGSTGRPKGVMVTHGNVSRLFSATQAWFGFDERDVWTLFHSYAFDFSVWELWGALAFGGRLVVVPYWVSRAPEAFGDLLARERVTVLNQTPSAFGQLVRAEQSVAEPKPLSLRLVILGGEAVEPRSLGPWFERHGDRQPQVVNMYGITETTVHVTYRPLTAADASGAGGARRPAASVIGVPIPDLEVYLLDGHRQLVPAGVPGEIYVGGAGLARGYLNRPELTAERFVPHPFRAEPGARLYRSGDLARHLPGRDMEYVGRADQQVKIRGFRVEPAEIEAALAQHPAVAAAVVAAVVAARGGEPGGKTLVAYVVAEAGGPKPAPSELRGLLKAKLPDYMVPSAFVFLDALPRTASGKVDRGALPAPDPTRPELGRAFVAPRTPTEEALAQIWAKVLGIEKVGVHDNFFDLGGHSLLATRVVSRAADAFKVALTVRSLFEAPTVAGLAEAVGVLAGQGRPAHAVAPPISPVDRQAYRARPVGGASLPREQTDRGPETARPQAEGPKE